MKKCLLCIPVLFSLLTYSFGQTTNSKESEKELAKEVALADTILDNYVGIYQATLAKN